MKKILLLLTLAFFASTQLSLAQKDTSNVYTNMKKNVTDITKGVAGDAKNALHGVDSAFKNLADSSQISFGSVYKDIRSGIEGMAQALKVGAEHVYKVLVQQQIVKSIMWLVVLIFSIISLRLAWKTTMAAKWKKIDVSEVTDVEDSKATVPVNAWGFLCFIFWAMGVIGVIVVICHLQTMITGFVNPEFGAMKDIVDFVRQIKGAPAQ